MLPKEELLHTMLLSCLQSCTSKMPSNLTQSSRHTTDAYDGNKTRLFKHNYWLSEYRVGACKHHTCWTIKSTEKILNNCEELLNK